MAVLRLDVAGLGGSPLSVRPGVSVGVDQPARWRDQAVDVGDRGGRQSRRDRECVAGTSGSTRRVAGRRGSDRRNRRRSHRSRGRRTEDPDAADRVAGTLRLEPVMDATGHWTTTQRQDHLDSARRSQRSPYFQGEIAVYARAAVRENLSKGGSVPNARQLEPNRRLAQADRQLATGGLSTCRSGSEAVQ